MAHLKVVSAGAMVSPPTSQVDVLTPLQQLQLCMFGLQENGCLRHTNYFAADQVRNPNPGLLVSPSERADRVGASYERTSTPGVPGQTGPAEPGYGPDLQTTAPSAVQHPAKLPTSGHGPMSGSWPAFAHPTMQRQLNVPEMPQEFLQHHRQGHPCEQLVMWCGYAPGAEPTELIPGRQKHMSCRGSVHFARWLFAQARGQITPFSVLVVTWRDAKACLAAIRAAQTGNDADLRLDSKRPPLSQLIGHMAAGSPRLAVARVIVAVDSAKMHALAAHLIKQRQVSLKGIKLQVCQVPLEPERAKPAQLERQCPACLQSPSSGLSTASSSSSASPRQRGAEFPRNMSEASSWNSAPSTDLFFGFRVRRLDL
mmetsp:Transcript_18346/g.51886  ORF Transcript_18346/g.51886 Transcript_18346/m.51886 type:complete len:369 (-) Transcript_18346:456-1562(-)